MKIFLLIRRTQKYFETGKIDLGHMVPDHDKVHAAIARWDFEVRYLDFRRRLRLIAEKSWKHNDFDGVISWSNSKAAAELPANSWLVPMDEDDWVAPFHFTKALRAAKLAKDCRQISWRVQRFAANGDKVENKFEESCGYALKNPCDWQQVTNHMAIDPSKSHRIQKLIAVRNETVASLGYMMYRDSSNMEAALRQAIRPYPEGLPRYFAQQFQAYQKLLKSCLPPATAASGHEAQD